MKTLIIDCGSTKADYALVDSDSSEYPEIHRTGGINAALSSVDDMLRFFEAIPEIRQADELQFYGAGCLPGEVSEMTETAARIASVRGLKKVTAASDMLGAARALLGRKRGVACILGTGSNSCLYDGESIVDNIPALGYVLGDEGSGNHLGRLFLTAYFKRRLSPELAAKFREEYPGVNVRSVVENVYRRPGANAWLAQFSRFLSASIDYPEVQAIVDRGLGMFIDNNILPYGERVRHEEIGFVGSVAVVFSNRLEAALQNRGLRLGKVIGSPIEGLVRG